MNVVITGGTGLIGRALTAELLANGHEVRLLSRDPAGAEGIPAGVDVVRWDAKSADALGPAVEGADAVVHLAGANIGEGRWTDQRKRLIRDSRVDSSDAIAQALSASGMPRILVQGSAVGYYGARRDEPLDETAAPGDDFLARTCRAWEGASESVVDTGVRRTVARTGVVLSRDGGALPKMALPFKLMAGGPAGDGRQWLPWIHIDDQVAALRFLLENEAATGAYNLTAPGSMTNRDFSRALGRALSRPALMPAPAFALRLALGEMATLVLDGQRAVPRRLLDAGFEFGYPEASQALGALYA